MKKKINFTALEVEDVEGNKHQVNIAKALGNMLYMNVLTIEECDLGRAIYYSEGEMELDEKQALYPEKTPNPVMSDTISPVALE